MKIATSIDPYLLETDNVKEALNIAKEDGFQYMGINIKEPIQFYQNMSKDLTESDLNFCVHANAVDTNPASLNEGIRELSVLQIKEAIDLAKELGAKVVTFHPGKFRNTFKLKEAYNLLDISLSELLPYAKSNNILLCIENMEPGRKDLCVSKTQVEIVLNKHKDLFFTIDFAHLAMLFQTEDEILDFYNIFKNRVMHVHISGNMPRVSHAEVSLQESIFDFSFLLPVLRSLDCIIRIENRERTKNIQSLNFLNQ